MADKKFLTAPIKTDQMPPGIPFIVGNEAAERFSFYGMRAILVVFMTQYLRNSSGNLAVMSESEANQWYHGFVSLNYFLPIFGAILADAFWGKYRTIFWISFVYCAGHLALSMDDTRMGLALGLILIAIGAGGIKPCVSANVGDQFGESNQHLLSKAFGWFYISINFGSTFSMMLIPWLLQHYGTGWAFGVPGILMAIATLIFWLGRYKYVHIPPTGRTFFKENFNREGLTAIARISLVYIFVAVFWALWDQSGSEWVLQAEKLNRHFSIFGFQGEILSSQVQTLNGIFIMVFVIVCQYWLYPAISRIFPLNEVRKIGLGIVVTCAAFAIIAWIESQLSAGLKPSVAWQVPAYVVLSLGEVMVSATALEFAYTQAPKKMKSIVMILYLLPISAGNLFTAWVQHFIANPDGTSKLPGATFYVFFIGLGLLAAVCFAVITRFYREKTYLQDEAPAHS